MHSLKKLGVVSGSACILLAAGCKPGLDVTNPNNPDIARAVSTPSDVKALANSSVNTWYLGATNVEPWIMLSITADAGTMNFGNFGARFNNLEPRIPYANSSAGNDKGVSETPWTQNYRALGAANDALRAFAAGLKLTTQAETDKFRRLAQFTQAASLTNLALLFDKSFITDQATVPGAPLSLSGYKVVSADAVTRWAALGADAAGKTDVYEFGKGEGFPMVGGDLTAAKLSRIAYTYAALTMAYTPRNAAEAATVNWAQVATYADKGIGTGSAGAPFDFGVVGDFSTWYSDFLDYSESPSWVNVDQRVIHLMDANVPAKFDGTKVAPTFAGNDHRLETDFEFTNAVVGTASRGIFMQSPYRHKRYEYYGFDYGDEETGPAPYILAAENDLVRAEALIRSGGSRQTAVDLINNTRVGRGQLSAATVGETDASLLAKIAYERDIELFNTNGWQFFQRRHIDGLQAGTVHHLPIPASELETLGLPVYTFGGVGQPLESLVSETPGLFAATFPTPGMSARSHPTRARR